MTSSACLLQPLDRHLVKEDVKEEEVKHDLNEKLCSRNFMSHFSFHYFFTWSLSSLSHLGVKLRKRLEEYQ